MKNTIFSSAVSILLSVSLHAATLSDHAGLKLELEDNGNISGVELGGAKLPKGSLGGFYLLDPNSTKKIPLTGKTVSKDGKLQLTFTSPVQAKVSAEITEGQGYIEVAGVLEDLTGKDRGLWLGFNLPVNTTGWKWGKTLSVSPVITNEAPGKKVASRSAFRRRIRASSK
ncbi:MAG: hypothetical protein EBY32_10810 [Proteobacteria bacterium]|nr:hypothetical protein [Pseudomonadota bacterium]